MIRRLAPHVRLGADHRRDRHRQGAGRARAAHPRAAPRSPLHRRELLGGQRHRVRERAVRPRARRFPRRDREQARASSSSPTAARSSSTRSAACRRRRRRSCCACSRWAKCSRVGALEPRRVDVHVLAATNRDLRAEVAAGRFRGDLYYRLNIVEVKLPPLRDRREDIPYLTAAFVREIARSAAEAAARPDARRRRAADRRRRGKATCASCAT